MVNFYDSKISELALKEEIDEYRFKNPRVIDRNLKEDTFKLLSGIRIFDEKRNAFLKGGMHIVRSCIKEIEQKLKANNCLVIKGRRFSGKSFILCCLCDRQKKYTIYYFPSTTMVDELLVTRLFEQKQDSLFIFDSNALSSSVYFMLANSKELLEKNNNKVILAVNSNDNFIIDILHSEYMDINNCFDYDELKENNINADKYGLTRRRKNNTNLDYLHLLRHEQKIPIQKIVKLPNVLTKDEQILLLLLCALDKIFMADILALGITTIQVKEFCTRFPVIVEEVFVEKDEATTHSATKLVHNGKITLLDKLREFPHDETITCIKRITRAFKNDYQRRRIYIEVILFDTLNQLFGGKTGAGQLIFKVYEALEEQLSDSPHYWLQRAKSIYRLFPGHIDEVKNAYSYAKKCYLDGYGDFKVKAALTTSLICCLLAELHSEEQKCQYQYEAVRLAHEAVFSAFYRLNPKYLNRELNNNKRNNSYEMLRKVCNSVNQHCTNLKIKQMADEIIDKLTTMQEKPTTSLIRAKNR